MNASRLRELLLVRRTLCIWFETHSIYCQHSYIGTSSRSVMCIYVYIDAHRSLALRPESCIQLNVECVADLLNIVEYQHICCNKTVLLHLPFYTGVSRKLYLLPFPYNDSNLRRLFIHECTKNTNTQTTRFACTVIKIWRQAEKNTQEIQ